MSPDFTKQDLKILGLILLLFLYYSQAYLRIFSHTVSDTDTASVLGISLLQFHGFPEISGALPVVLSPAGEPSFSEVTIKQSPWISSLIGTFSLLSHCDVSRVAFWFWQLSLFLFFGNGFCFVLSLMKKNLVTLPLMILLTLYFHNLQIHLAYAGGELQELFSLALAYAGGFFLLKEEFVFSGICLASALGFQPDEVFPWVFALGFFFILQKNKPQSWVKFGLACLLTLSPFLVQQWIVSHSSPVPAWDFIRNYQILVTPYAMFAQFHWLGWIYLIGLFGVIFYFPDEKKFILTITFFFLFFSLYPLALNFLFPQYSILAHKFRHPVECFGKFKDLIFPFSGKYYFYRQSISWYLIPFTFLGIARLIQKCAPKFQKGITGALILFFLVYHGYGHGRYLSHLGPTARKETAESYSYLAKKMNKPGYVLTPPWQKVAQGVGGNYNWWAGPQMNRLSEGLRTYVSGSDVNINGQSSAALYGAYFWNIVYSGTQDQMNVELCRASRFYTYLILEDRSNRYWLKMQKLSILKLIDSQFPYYLFEFVKQE